MKVRNKLIAVTGAASGLGRELVRELLRRGARVAALDINARELEQTAALAAAPDRLGTFVVDITDRAQVEALPDAIAARLGPLDGVINCAGIIQPFVPIEQLDYEAITRVFNVNWLGTLYVTKTLLPHLRTRPESHIVNVSSMGGFLPVPGQSVYGASKAAVKLFTEGLNAEMRGTSVRVTVVFPGAIATNIARNSGADIGSASAEKSPIPILTPEAAARQLLDGMERDAYRVMVGKDAKALDALYRLSPERAVAFVADKMKQLLQKR